MDNTAWAHVCHAMEKNTEDQAKKKYTTHRNNLKKNKKTSNANVTLLAGHSGRRSAVVGRLWPVSAS